MLDLDYLKQRKVSSEAYKKIFTLEPAEYPKKIRDLVNLISGRSRDGYEMGLRDYRAYAAVDFAYETPFNQTTPTLVRHIMQNHLNADKTLEALKQWGLSESELFLEIPTESGTRAKVLNPPVFYQLFVPIVMAYVKAVEAPIFNERNQSPLLPYRPLKETTEDRIQCEIVTDLIDTQATWYGYSAVLRQAIHQMLKYGVMLAFPREEWHCEQQVMTGEDGKPEVVTVKEGLRYTHPHPTRMYYDLNYPLTSVNTDSGCEFAGHWRAMRYGDILDDKLYWNKRSIFAGTNWFQEPIAGNYFNEVFKCRLQFPDHCAHGPMTREDRNAYYQSQSDRDKAVFVTEHFQKLIPKQWGLGDYGYPVWHRFTLAGDDTVIWAEPCAYTPMWFMGYDYDEQASRNASFALELIPWQDTLGMILSQMILTARQNLTNVIFYNNQAVDKGDIEKMANMGEQKYKGVQFIGYDSLKMAAARIDMERVFSPVSLSKASIQELLQMIPTVLSIMEKVLGISAQMAGAAASHQQSKAEVLQTGGSSQQRIYFISASVDEGTNAWMRQLYDGNQAYRDPEVTAKVSSDIKDLEQHLAAMGFQIKGRGKDTVLVSGHKRKIRLEGFASGYEGPAIAREKEAGQVVMTVVGTIAGQDDLKKEVGAKNLITMIEFAAWLMGAPRGFRLKTMPEGQKGDEIPENILQAIQQAQQATMQAIEQKIAQPVAKEVAQDQQQIAQMQQVLKQLEGIYKVAEAQQQKVQIEAQKAQADAQLKTKAEQAKQARLDAAEARKQARLDKAAQAEIERKRVQAEADTAIKAATATAKAGAAKKE